MNGVQKSEILLASKCEWIPYKVWQSGTAVHQNVFLLVSMSYFETLNRHFVYDMGYS